MTYYVITFVVGKSQTVAIEAESPDEARRKLQSQLSPHLPESMDLVVLKVAEASEEDVQQIQRL